ncbi:hypothetical protein [Streptomyces sp. NPDC001250]|uniref:hypothetical protein n=1 Tax=unclassified Streptomyces TaxID=2593676 RepID=UPI00331DD24B
MAWRDRLRRRATAPGAGGTPAGTGSAQPAAPGAMSTPATDAAGPSVPGDWDGGWRRTPPPTLTVARSALGVSDGLTFRSGLASWQNPSFDAGLGHAVLPAAPAGLVHGVTGPATPHATYADGGPLLLRVQRPQPEEAAESGPPTEESAGSRPTAGTERPSAPAAPQVSRRTRPGAGPRDTGKRDGSGPRKRAGNGTSGPAGTTSADASPTTGDAPHVQGGAGPTQGGSGPVQGGSGSGGSGGAAGTASSGGVGGAGAAASPSVQRSAVAPASRSLVAADPLVTVSAPEAAVQRSAAGSGPSAPVPELPVVRRIAVVPHAAGNGPAPRTPSAGPGTTPHTAHTAPQRRHTTDTAPQDASAERARAAEPGGPRSVRPSALGPSLTVARRPTAPMRRIAALRPDRAATRAAAGRDLTPTARAEETPNAAPPVPETPNAAPPVAETPNAAPLIAETPRPAPSVRETPNATPPVQRTADPVRPGSRPPLGAPVPELPSTARPLTDSGPETPRPATDAHLTTDPALPIVQRQAGDAAGAGATPSPYVVGTATTPQTRATGGADAAPTAPEPPDQATRSRPSGTRARGGLGAPLPEMPSTADLPRQPGARGRGRGGPGAPLPGIPPTADASRTAGPGGQAPLPSVQRTRTAAHPDRTTGQAPANSSGPQTPTAPLLGTPGSEDRSTDLNSPVNQETSGTGTPSASPVLAAPLVSPLASGSASSSATEPGPAVQRTTTSQAQPTPSTGTASSPVEASAPSGAGMAAPGTVVVARAVDRHRPGPGAVDAQRPGAIRRQPLAVWGQQSAPRTLALLAARPLTVNTRAPEGVAPPSGTHAPEPPVVAASWRRDPDPGARTSHTEREPHRGVPHVQRTATGSVPSASASASASDNSPSTYASSPTRRRAVPVVRPNPSVQRSAAGGDKAVRPLALPLSDPQAAPLQDRPGHTAPGTPPVPVVRAARTTPAPAAPVQREVGRTGGGGAASAGVPVTGVPARGRQRSASAPPAPGSVAARETASAGARQEPVIDLDELARRLLDPMARLLRADLRRGRERAGRPYDGRR